MSNETTAMILSGSGYDLQISPEAIENKVRVLSEASVVLSVTSNDESADAAYQMRKLAQMRILIDKSRKEVKEPVIRVGKMIDKMAKDFLEEIEAEEGRIKGLIGDHAQQMLVLQAEKEEQERIAYEAAQAATLAAESGGIAAMIDYRNALSAILQASDELAAVKIAQGVRFAWDFEIDDIHALADRRADLVSIEPRRSLILAMLKALEENGEQVDLVVKNIGINAYKKPVVSSK